MIQPLTLKINGMHCQSCELLTKDELSQLQGISDIKVSYKDGLANLTLDTQVNSETEVIEAIKRAGYEATIQHIQNGISGNGTTSESAVKALSKPVKNYY